MVIGGWLRLLEMLLLGALKWGLKGVLKEALGRVSRVQRGVRRAPEWGSGEGDIFVSKCILKVEYAKDAYIPGLEITRFPRNSAVFGKNWASSATIHPESDCSHTQNIQVNCRVF